MAKEMKLEDYEARVNKSTGLVPMVHLHHTTTELKGDVRGYEPETAMRMHDKGFCAPVDQAEAEMERLEGEGDGQGNENGPNSLTRKDLGNKTEIPQDWESMHMLQRIALAKEIAGKKQSEKMTEAQADKIINDELDRREGLSV